MFLSLIRLARPRQWIKNGVVLAALIFAGKATIVDQVELALLAMLVFCLLSSAVYTLNDIVDRNNDRNHPRKKNRPLASGAVSVSTAVAMLALLLAVSLTVAWQINTGFLAVSLTYFSLNVLYSFWLKKVVIADVMSIALGFVLRAYAGAFAIEVPASKWLLINTLFLALFLGFGKRRHELTSLEDEATSHRAILGQYSAYLLDQLIAVVTPAVVVVYMLYTFSAEVSQRLGTENLFLTIPFVVYGIFRYLYLIHREDEGGSPTRILTSDRPIFFTVLLWLATVVIVIYNA
jgi:4-hydroxybenzoate polyprenyltransferase